MFGDFAPGPVHFNNNVLLSEAWKRPHLLVEVRPCPEVALIPTGRLRVRPHQHEKLHGRSVPLSDSRVSPDRPALPADPSGRGVPAPAVEPCHIAGDPGVAQTGRTEIPVGPDLAGDGAQVVP